jgi:hypothetical protein
MVRRPGGEAGFPLQQMSFHVTLLYSQVTAVPIAPKCHQSDWVSSNHYNVYRHYTNKNGFVSNGVFLTEGNQILLPHKITALLGLFHRVL